MNAVYPAAVDAFLRGQIAIEVDTVKAQLLEGYSYSDAHVYLADVSGSFAPAVAVSVTGVSAGTVNVDPITFASVSSGHTVSHLLLYVDSGSPSTSRLLVALDRRADTTPVAQATNDGDISFEFPRGCFRL